MNSKKLLQDQSHRLVFVLDKLHPQDVRVTLEDWIKPLRGAITVDWEQEIPTGLIPIILPTSTRLQKKKSTGTNILVRPIHQDLLTIGDQSQAEEMADAVVEATKGEGPFQDIVAIFLMKALARETEASRKLALRHQRVFEKKVKAAQKEISLKENDLKSFIEIFSQYLDLQEELTGVPSLETIAQNLELLSKKLDRKKNWRLILRADAHLTCEGELFYLGNLKGSPLFLEKISQETSALNICSTSLIVISLTRLVRKWETEEGEVKPGHIVQEAFQALPFPLLLLGEKGEVLQHNTSFVKMNLPPSRVGKLQELDQVQTKEMNWTVRRTSLTSAHGQRALFTFLPDRPKGFKNGSPSGGQELGIITSSIAHELNNPIGGLLVALELLSMDDHWDEESLTQLAEMRQGALRCKQLIETFLGFSRLKTNDAKIEKDLLKNCFEQALHLQRFRMVESGLRVTISHQQQHPFAYALHAPTATMLAYLVIGEMMTAFHHLKLLENQSARGMQLDIQVQEDADRFKLILKTPLSIKQSLNSKLLQFLLQQERLQLDVELDNSLSFLHQNVLI
ncbi:MAG: hypothetical protein K2P81_08240 [Bacteriovoracaceae bacterium]|nr:hypothetical protein [Bacteriovoracaceae bacterium]